MSGVSRCLRLSSGFHIVSSSFVTPWIRFTNCSGGNGESAQPLDLFATSKWNGRILLTGERARDGRMIYTCLALTFHTISSGAASSFRWIAIMPSNLSLKYPMGMVQEQSCNVGCVEIRSRWPLVHCSRWRCITDCVFIGDIMHLQMHLTSGYEVFTIAGTIHTFHITAPWNYFLPLGRSRHPILELSISYKKPTR